jgi:two-component system cell cycle sensor histidine kinase PleC
MEVPVTYADGSRHDVIVKTGTFADADGRTAGIIGVIVDITDRKHAERELARETAILEATLENVAQGIVMVDGECRVVAYNKRYLELTGLPAGLLDGRPLVDEVLRRQGEHGIPFSGLEPLARESRPAPCGAAGALTLEHVLADGTVLSIVSTVLPDGGCVRTFSDVTVRKEAERRLEQQAQDLAVTAVQLEAERRRAETARVAAEDANRAKSDFLATMSHELRTPLNAILGFSEILKDRPFGDMDGDRIADYAGDIHASGVHLLTLINDVLDLAKIESGKLEIEPVPVDLEDLLGSTTRLVVVRAETRGLRLDLEVSTPPPALVADERAVKQIAFNLLSNAIKFTQPGGTIKVRAEPDPDGGAAIIVADTGCGIPADQIARVMRPFEQRHNTYAGGAGGTGLGLALVQALAELHGGEVALESAVGIGTTVTVRLPARPAAPPLPRMAAARA